MEYRINRIRRLRAARRMREIKPPLHWGWGLTLIILLLIGIIYGNLVEDHPANASEVKPQTTDIPVPSKVIETRETTVTIIKEVPVEIVKEKEVVIGDKLDLYVDKYSKKYGKGIDQESKFRATLHCLLYYESKHTAVNGFGDNGKAGGPLQFWEGTYLRMRGQMMKLGLVDHIGDRMDLEDAIETTAWALSNGNAKEWGPILRGDCTF